MGALTSKPYAFIARPWELKKTDSIDVLDAVGANIRIDSRGPEVLRILPRVNDDVNEEWLADKSRFSLDGLKRRRLDSCWVRRDGGCSRANWTEAFAAIAARLQGLPGARIGALAGNLADAESMLALKDLMAALGSTNLDCRQDGAAVDVSRRDFYTFNSGIAGIDEADALLLVGSNPRREAPLINARIRKRWLAGGFPVAAIGPARRSHLRSCLARANSPRLLLDDAAGVRGDAARGAKRPMLILGQGALARPDGDAVLAACLAARRCGRRARAGLARVQRAAHCGRPGGRAGFRLPARARRQGRRADAGRRGGRAVAARRRRVRTRHASAATRSSSTRATTATAARRGPT